MYKRFHRKQLLKYSNPTTPIHVGAEWDGMYEGRMSSGQHNWLIPGYIAQLNWVANFGSCLLAIVALLVVQNCPSPVLKSHVTAKSNISFFPIHNDEADRHVSHTPKFAFAHHISS